MSESTAPTPEGRQSNAAAEARRLAEQQEKAAPKIGKVGGPQVVRIVDADLVEPSPKGGLLEVFQQRYLLKLIVARMLASMYAASLLGLLWSYIQPAMRFGTYYVVLGVFLKNDSLPNYPLHLFVGLAFVNFFIEAWNTGTRSILGNSAIVLKMRMPREVFPVAAMWVAAYHTFPQILLMIVICLIVGWHITLGGVAAFFLGSAILILFSMAAALLFSALNVFYRDWQNVVGTMVQFISFFVPMMYPFSKVWSSTGGHGLLYQIYMANPLTQAVILFQRTFWWDTVPAADKLHGTYLFHVKDYMKKPGLEFPPDLWLRSFIMVGACLVLVWLCQRYFSRVENQFPERL